MLLNTQAKHYIVFQAVGQVKHSAEAEPYPTDHYEVNFYIYN